MKKLKVLIWVMLGAYCVESLALNQVVEPPLQSLIDPPALVAAPQDAGGMEKSLPSRAIHLNSSILAALAARRLTKFNLPLAAGSEYQASVEHYENVGDSYSAVRGSLAGYRYSAFSGVFRDGQMTMQISDGQGGEFQIRPQAGGHALVVMPRGELGVCPPPSAMPDTAPHRPEPKGIKPKTDPQSRTTYVDMLILYTSNAMLAAGGKGPIEAKARQFVADANWVYDRSGTHIQLRLVGLSITGYDDSSQDLSQHLSRLGNLSDGYIDDVASLRTAIGADLVCLLPNGRANSGNTLGIANINGWAAVVEWSNDTSVFTHEIGHNLGCNHEIGSTGTPTDGYNHAYHWTEIWNLLAENVTEERRTVMYSLFDPSKRTDYLSNPNINYTFTGNDCGGLCANVDRPLGVLGAEFNALYVMENRASTAANTQPYFYVNSSGAAGDASQFNPENDLGRVYSVWFPNTQEDASKSATVRLAAGNYAAPQRIDQKCRIEKWTGNGSARLAR